MINQYAWLWDNDGRVENDWIGRLIMVGDDVGWRMMMTADIWRHIVIHDIECTPVDYSV